MFTIVNLCYDWRESQRGGIEREGERGKERECERRRGKSVCAREREREGKRV